MHQTLLEYIKNVALKHNLALGLVDEVFSPPLTEHLRLKINYEPSIAASLGKHGLVRTDGSCELTVVGLGGSGDLTTMLLAKILSKEFPKGLCLKSDIANLVFMSSSLLTLESRPDRARVLLKIPFYNMESTGEQDEKV